MASIRFVWLIAVGTLLSACFHPSYDHPACGPNGECPNGLSCNDQNVCAGPGNVLIDSGDPPLDAASSCLAHWLDGTVTLSTPQVLPNQSVANVNERDPWVSLDGLTLYYTFSVTQSDIYLASRTSTSLPFGDGAAVVNLNSSGNDSRASLTADQKLLVLASNRGGGQVGIYLSSRPDANSPFGVGDMRHLGNVNTAATDHLDPFLTRDGLKLYLAPLPTTGLQRIALATRADTNGDFGPPALVPVINDTSSGDADPAVSLDDRIIVFSSTRATGVAGTGGTNLWYAMRADPAQDFGPPKLVPAVNSDLEDGDPMLSADGCELYFASTRGGGTGYNLYSARIAN